MENQTSWKAPQYKAPPIVERVVSVTGDIQEDTFYAKFDEWREIISPQFPEYDPQKDWNLNIEVKEGVPMLSEAMPEIKITHRFWKLNSEGKRFLSMRIMPNQIILNLVREGTRPHHFEELYFALETWFPRWISHFGVNGCSNVSLDYINLLSAATTPQFITPDQSIQLGAALSVFTGVPGSHVRIIPPYDCQMGLMLDPEKPAIFALRIHGVDLPNLRNAVRVDFHTAINKDSPSLSQSQVLSETLFLHKTIIEYFQTIFTKQAKDSFGLE